MPTDAPATPAPMVIDDALAELMASPAFQAQMAALTQQAAAQVQALVAALRQAESQMQPALPPDDVPVGLAVEPGIAPPVPGGWEMALLPPEAYPIDGLAVEGAVKPGETPIAPQTTVSARELADDLLAAIPAAPAEPPSLGAVALSGPAPETVEYWILPESHRAGAEGGNAA